MTAWALIGWQRRLPGSLCISIKKHLQYCHLHLLSCNFCFLLSNVWDLLQKSIPLVDQKGLGFMETVRLIQNMCKMIPFCTSRIERHPLDTVSFWLRPSTGSWGFPSHSGSSCCSLCRDWKKKGADTLPFSSPDFSFTDTCWGSIFTPEKLFYTTQLCNSSRQK